MGKIVSKFVFMPPKNVAYVRGDLILLTKHQSSIQVKVIENGAKHYMLISHGNAEDLASVYEWALTVLISYVSVNVVLYGIWCLYRVYWICL
jgi:hypothetical protein